MQGAGASVTVLTPGGAVYGTYAQTLLAAAAGLSFDRCEHQLMTDSIRSLHNHATVQPGLTYEQQVAARRARNQEFFAQLGLSSLASSFKSKPQQPVAPCTCTANRTISTML
jgi:Neuraminidase (sialidase)